MLLTCQQMQMCIHIHSCTRYLWISRFPLFLHPIPLTLISLVARHHNFTHYPRALHISPVEDVSDLFLFSCFKYDWWWVQSLFGRMCFRTGLGALNGGNEKTCFYFACTLPWVWLFFQGLARRPSLDICSEWECACLYIIQNIWHHHITSHSMRSTNKIHSCPSCQCLTGASLCLHGCCLYLSINCSFSLTLALINSMPVFSVCVCVHVCVRECVRMCVSAP